MTPLRRTLLVGTGSHGHDIGAIWGRAHPEGAVLWQADEADDAPLGKFRWYSEQQEHTDLLLGPYYPTQRQQMDARFGHPAAATPLRDPLAMVGHSVCMGGGCVLAPNAMLVHSVTLGRHVHVNFGASMVRCVIGDYSTISPGATICGDVTIGKAVFIGAGATICDRVTIEDYATIGAGSTVLPESVVPSGEQVTGVWSRRADRVLVDP